MSTEKLKALAERRAAGWIPEYFALHKDRRLAFRLGALDPVLEEARRAMYRAEAFEEAGNHVPVTSKVFDILFDKAQAERDKLEKILSEGK